ncbi:Formin-binding protein 1, variant 2 [Balamuthia mandrillaris]
MSVAGSLWDQFPLVNKRAEEGKDFVAEVAGFLQKRAALEKDYAQKLIKLVTTVPAAESGTLHEAWKCMMLETEEIAKWHNGFGDAMVEDVREKILAFLRDEKIQRKTLEQNGTAVTKELQGCTEKKEKAQANFERARKQQDKSQEEYEKLNVSNQPAQVVLKAAKKLQKDIKAAEKADAAYKEAVTAMQQAQEKMYNTEMPQILEEYQVLDKKRLDLMKACLTKLVALQQSLPTIVSEKCQLMKVQAEKMDSEADIYAFIIANISSKIKPRLVEYEPYDPELGKCRGPPAPLPSLHSFSTLESSSGSHLSPSLQSASSSSSLGQEGSTQQRLPSGGQTSSGNLRKGSFSYRKGRKGTLKARGDHHSDAPEDESSESERDDSSGASSTIELAKHTPRDESGRRDTGSRERSETDFSDRGKDREATRTEMESETKIRTQETETRKGNAAVPPAASSPAAKIGLVAGSARRLAACQAPVWRAPERERERQGQNVCHTAPPLFCRSSQKESAQPRAQKQPG